MKKNILFTLFMFSLGFAFAQLKITNKGLVRVGFPSTSSSYLTKGLEIKLDTVLFHYLKATSPATAGGSAQLIMAGKPRMGDPYIPYNGIILSTTTSKRLQIGSSNTELYSIYSNAYYSSNSTGVITVSDSRMKTNIADLPTSIEKVMALRPVKFDYIQKDTNETEELRNLRLNKLGFIAQEVKELFPEVVSYNKEIDLFALDYSALVPVLTKAMQELQEEISLQKQELEDLHAKIEDLLEEQGPQKSQVSNEKAKNADVSQGGILYQNIPNPFNTQTEIKCMVPESSKQAFIYIHDLQGKQMKAYPISNKGLNHIEIKANEFVPGMYLYSLMIDNSLVDSKRMVITQ